MKYTSGTRNSSSQQTLLKLAVTGIALFASGFTWADPAANPGVVIFNGQMNNGNQHATVELQNIQVNEVEINSTALGNNLRVVTNDAFRGNNELQRNAGNQNASVAIRGPYTAITTGTVNATALGNNASYLGISNTSLNAVTARQENTGNQTAGVVWNEDPSARMNINASALGNNLSVGRQ